MPTSSNPTTDLNSLNPIQLSAYSID